MAWVTRVPRKSGVRHKVAWRDHRGKQHAQTFLTAREASAFKGELERSQRLGGYTDPSRGRIRASAPPTRDMSTSPRG